MATVEAMMVFVFGAALSSHGCLVLCAFVSTVRACLCPQLRVCVSAVRACVSAVCECVCLQFVSVCVCSL